MAGALPGLAEGFLYGAFMKPTLAIATTVPAIRLMLELRRSSSVVGNGVCIARWTTNPATLLPPSATYPVKPCAVRGWDQS